MRHQDKANQSILTVEQFGWMTNYINHLMTNTQKLIDLLDQTSDVVDRPAAVELLECQGVIEFENVTFSYEQLKKGSSKQSKPALDGVSFSVKRGEHVALVGESGSGKSTIFRLIFRFFDVQQGSIKVDGLDVRDYTQSSLRQAIGVVQQDVCKAPLHHAAILIKSA
jgi:ATP-binding cassette subfamily B (MDR/TAP) protein 6